MRYFLLTAAVLLIGCGNKPSAVEEFALRPLTLPNGKVIQVESAYSNIELLRGLMFRESLAPDRGMLFSYPHPDHYQTVMYNVLIPLDIVWMDADRRIVQIDESQQPCKTQASQCPKIGGKKIVSFALQIGGGLARRYRLETGQVLQF